MKFGVAVVAMAVAVALNPAASSAEEAKKDQVVVLSDEAMDNVTAGANVWDLFKNVDLEEWTGSNIPNGAKVYVSKLSNGDAWTSVFASVKK